jgi:ribulose-phosphate 3-epimerase
VQAAPHRLELIPIALQRACVEIVNTLLGPDVERVLAAGADMIHFDVMDNCFVPNLSFGVPVLAALRKHGIQAPMDVHLMVAQPERLMRSLPRPGRTPSPSITSPHPMWTVACKGFRTWAAKAVWR